LTDLEKAIGSKVYLGSYQDFYAIEYNDCVSDLLLIEEVQKLDEYNQHLKTTRFQHSINVSYYSYLVCKFLHCDYRSAARAGLLHDLFLYDWRVDKQPEGNHAVAHPIVALRNAQKAVTLNKIEQDAIVKHMWPLTFVPPRYKESFVVSMMDKYCAGLEVAEGLWQKLYDKRRKHRKVATGDAN